MHSALSSRQSASRSRCSKNGWGARLLNRTARGLSVTAAGQDYYESSVRLLAEFEEADARIGRGQAAPTGMIRVASSAGFGRMYVLPKLPEFFARFPEVAVDFNVSERFISLIEDGIDVAVRIGHLSDSALVARRIGTMTVATVASPAYLERAGELRTPADLTRHDCIGFVHHGALTSWGFNGPAGPMTIEPKGQVRSNDAEHLRAAALSGLGISQSASWLYAPEIASGEVRQILTDYAPHDFPIHAVSAGACRAAYGCSSIF